MQKVYNKCNNSRKDDFEDSSESEYDQTSNSDVSIRSIESNKDMKIINRTSLRSHREESKVILDDIQS